MEKTLTQDEINSLLRSSKAGEIALDKGAAAPRYTPFAFGQASRISKQQVQSITQLHERFARNLKNRTSASLQANLEINLMSVEELPYGDVVQSFPENNYLVALSMFPTRAATVLSLDLSIAMSMINLLLGGDGNPAIEPRPLTEIEEGVIESVIEIVSSELSAAWRQILEMDFSLGQKLRHTELYRIMSSYDKTLFLSFEVRMLGLFGTMSLAIPTSASSLLLRKMKELNSRSRMSKPEAAQQLRERLKDAMFGIELTLPSTALSGKDLLALRPGSTILLNHAIQKPVVLWVEDKKLFTALPVRSRQQRGALVQQELKISQDSDKGAE
jgi:flagellar motor switch protein FliM